MQSNKKKKMISVSSVSRQFFLFEPGNIEILNKMGYEVHCAANYSDYDKRLEQLDIIKEPFSIKRCPFHPGNIKAYFELKKMIENGGYDFVHCHSPIGSVLARLAASNYRKKHGLKVIYTAHGFHFFKGGPILSWMLYYPIEKFLSRYTDVLVTVCNEDYNLALNKMHCKKVYKINGIGVDTKRFRESKPDRNEKRREIGVPPDCKLLLSVGELRPLKNHSVIIKALARLNDKTVYYCIAGRGEYRNKLQDLADKLGVGDRVKFLGYRSDVDELCKIADIFCFPSLREGMPVSLIEALASGLPAVCSKMRGINDLVKDNINGYKCDKKDDRAFAEKIRYLLDNPTLCREMSKKNMDDVKKYDKNDVKNDMKTVYTSLIV